MLDNARPGFNATAEFMVSGLPWITSSLVANGTISQFDFDYYSKFIVVKNNTAGTVARVGVTRLGLGTSNYFELIGGESISLDWRICQLHVSASTGSPTVSVIAGLTGIHRKQWPLITGSNGFGGVG